MKNIPVVRMAENNYFDQPVYLDPTYILLSPETKVTTELLNRLRRWGYEDVFSDGAPRGAPEYMPASQVTASTSLLDTDIKEKQRNESAQKVYYSLLNFTRDAFKVFKESNRLDLITATDRIKELIQELKTGRDSLLRFISLTYPSENYIIQHSVNSTICSLAVGDYIKLPPHKLIELGLSSLLHELGMIKLPENLYLSPKSLSPEERKMVKAHTVLGYRLLKGFSVSDEIALPALEHHERINGSGYPRGLRGDKLTLNARIIAATCSYDAMTVKRPFKSSVNGHAALLELLKGRQSLYDEQVVRAIIFCLSIFPIGMLVMLSNHSVGRVMRSSPTSPKLPLVQLLIDHNGNRISEPVLLKTSLEKGGIQILRALTREEIKSFGLKGGEDS